MSPSVTLSPTQAPFPYGVLAAALFANSLEDGAVSVSFDRDAKALDEDEALAAVGALLKGNEARSSSLLTSCIYLRRWLPQCELSARISRR